VVITDAMLATPLKLSLVECRIFRKCNPAFLGLCESPQQCSISVVHKRLNTTGYGDVMANQCVRNKVSLRQCLDWLLTELTAYSVLQGIGVYLQKIAHRYPDDLIYTHLRQFATHSSLC
jgi:hypothetical protein